MGLYGTYMRVTAAEAERLRADPESVLTIMGDTPYRSEYPKDALLDLDKAWHGLHFLLDRAGLPAEEIFGRTLLADPHGEEIVAILNPDEVARAAARLETLPRERFVGAYEPDAMMANDIYPSVWDEPGEGQLDWLLAHFDEMVPFFAGAATAGDALLMWVS